MEETHASSSGTVPGKYQFAGAELDPTTGLYHMGARFYDPTVGRWLNEDPSQSHHFNPLSLNVYTYAWNSPTGLIDENGLNPIRAALQGIVVHASVEEYFMDRFGFCCGARTELRIEGFGLRLDMMKIGPQGREVYELKPLWHLTDENSYGMQRPRSTDMRRNRGVSRRDMETLE